MGAVTTTPATAAAGGTRPLATATTRPGGATTARGPGPTLPARRVASTATARLDTTLSGGTRTEAAPLLRESPHGQTLVRTDGRR